MKPVLTESKLREIGAGSFFRPKDLEDLGFGYYHLQRFLRDGTIERVARGLYRLSDSEPTEHYSLAGVCARIPKAVICLLSALQVHDLGTQIPRNVWIAIPHKARRPRLPEFPLRIVHFSGPMLRYGVEQVRLEGVPARITSVSRTVVDLFRFRRLVGRDTAKEALREALNEGKTTADELWRAAEMCRALSLIGPYLEVLS